MRLFGLIGYPLSHSFSKKYFTEKFQREGITDCRYELFPLENINLIKKLINNEKDLVGLNVTIPYKTQVIQYLDELDEPAKEMNAVNVIKIDRDGNKIRKKGYNSDVYGFDKSIEPLLKEHHKKALILGTGGAARAVEYALKKRNIYIKYVSRTPKNENTFKYEDLNKDIIIDYNIIVNSSPVGMSPNTETSPNIPYDAITSNHLLFDLVYNPLETMFLKKGKEKGAAVKNGLEMLHLQAEGAWGFWSN